MKAGVLCARGELILMADADGATVAADEQRLEEALLAMKASPSQLAQTSGAAEPDRVSGSGRLGVVVGSRAHMQQQVRLPSLLSAVRALGCDWRDTRRRLGRPDASASLTETSASKSLNLSPKL